MLKMYTEMSGVVHPLLKIRLMAQCLSWNFGTWLLDHMKEKRCWKRYLFQVP
jgi:hypothetical protein